MEQEKINKIKKEILTKQNRNEILDEYCNTVENMLILEHNDVIIKILTNLLFNIELLKISHPSYIDIINIKSINALLSNLVVSSYINKLK